MRQNSLRCSRRGEARRAKRPALMMNVSRPSAFRPQKSLAATSSSRFATHRQIVWQARPAQRAHWHRRRRHCSGAYSGRLCSYGHNTAFERNNLGVGAASLMSGRCRCRRRRATDTDTSRARAPPPPPRRSANSDKSLFCISARAGARLQSALASGGSNGSRRSLMHWLGARQHAHRPPPTPTSRAEPI